MKQGLTETPPQGAKKRGVRIIRPEDVRRLLSRLINQNLRNEVDNAQLKAIAYTCQVLIKIFEMDLVEQRFLDMEGEIDEIRRAVKKT